MKYIFTLSKWSWHKHGDCWPSTWKHWEWIEERKMYSRVRWYPTTHIYNAIPRDTACIRRKQQARVPTVIKASVSLLSAISPYLWYKVRFYRSLGFFANISDFFLYYFTRSFLFLSTHWWRNCTVNIFLWNCSSDNMKN